MLLGFQGKGLTQIYLGISEVHPNLPSPIIAVHSTVNHLFFTQQVISPKVMAALHSPMKNPQRCAAEGWFRMGQALLLVSYEANIEFIPNVVVSNKTDVLNKRVRE